MTKLGPEYIESLRRCNAKCKHRRQCKNWADHEGSHNFFLTCARCAKEFDDKIKNVWEEEGGSYGRE